jgi:DNA-binding transcriptional MerR regulator
MDAEKKKTLEEKGFSVGGIAQFLGLTKNESRIIEAGLSLEEIQELQGLDLDNKAVRELLEARRDRESANRIAYIELDAI